MAVQVPLLRHQVLPFHKTGYFVSPSLIVAVYGAAKVGKGIVYIAHQVLLAEIGLAQLLVSAQELLNKGFVPKEHKIPVPPYKEEAAGIKSLFYVPTDFDTKRKALSRANAAEKGLK